MSALGMGLATPSHVLPALLLAAAVAATIASPAGVPAARGSGSARGGNSVVAGEHALLQVCGSRIRSTTFTSFSLPGDRWQKEFQPADGGSNRACRGAVPGDDLPDHFVLHTGIVSLDACKRLCTEAPTCHGIEYNAAYDLGRCEVWTREKGIGATAQVADSTCLRYGVTPDPFEPVDGGMNRACRGAVPEDDSLDYYELHTSVKSLDECKGLCLHAAFCTGVEYGAGYDGGRCEVWTRQGGISTTRQVPGTVCLRHGPSTDQFEPVDNGTDRVCRGADPTDHMPAYYDLHTGVATLSDCQTLCIGAPVCKGIEYTPALDRGRCEIWTRTGGVRASSVSEVASTCLRTRGEHFDLMDGSRDRACRGAVAADDAPEYYVLHTDVPSLENCKALCEAAPICTGIEHSPQYDGGRCEVWTRTGGISATTPANGSICLRFGPSTEQFQPIDGSDHRVCRGQGIYDDSPLYYVLHTGVTLLSACQALCAEASNCKGIEYNRALDGGRCEVWTRTGGIRATLPRNGSTCLRYGTLTEQFHLMDGGSDRACRGSDPADNSTGHSVVHVDVGSLAECKTLCVEAAVCKGIEYNPLHDSGRCEIWTRIGGIRATVQANGSTCLQYGTSAKHFHMADGGTSRACRGTDPNDNSANYYVLHQGTGSLDACLALCVSAPTCEGIEYSAEHDGGRCEVWTREGGIGTTVPSSGSTCLHYARSTEQFEPLAGGIDKACRGAVPTDDSDSYYSVHEEVSSLEACMELCVSAPVCRGIEYNPEFSNGRCEVWTRTGGISATSPVQGSLCLQYGPPTEQFGPVDNGTDRACRGYTQDDSSPNYYALHTGVASLSACQYSVSMPGSVGASNTALGLTVAVARSGHGLRA
eukprot:CAMPEP_0179116396 /NCGR_PEP_ID=MMETSP0796-20121207/54591_1 /TAXON_ID=73915 /ORGANISM="Pyrodinium bahamense, Strain pbaha01" /LENGTH=870 /DNA_ID=CAMNT_0020814671 /DNA_START=1 /DNA_END=2614 /DNA_ORIENTATION=-